MQRFACSKIVVKVLRAVVLMLTIIEGVCGIRP